MTGAEFRRQRRRLGITQVELAKRLGVHSVTLSRWETDAHPIPEAAAQLVQLLKKPVKKGNAR